MLRALGTRAHLNPPTTILLLQAVAAKLAAASAPPVVSGLLQLLSRLALMDVGGLVGALEEAVVQLPGGRAEAASHALTPSPCPPRTSQWRPGQGG